MLSGNTAAKHGGGIYCSQSSPTLTDCTLSANSASTHGGGLYDYGSASLPIMVTNCNIIGNSAGYSGGGIIATSLTITNCTITGNSDGDRGGGIYADSSTITNCTISGNSAGNYGGGINANSPTITNCIISGNSADYGGGINANSPTITNCTISGNSAGYYGGGICASYPTITNCIISGNSAGQYGGGIATWPSPTITNCIVAKNKAPSGGGICVEYGTIINCTLTQNTATSQGSGIYCWNNHPPTITNCILWDGAPNEIAGGSPEITYSDVRGGYAGEGNIGRNPLFMEPGIGDYHLDLDSPCIDSGKSGSGIPHQDLDGNPRDEYPDMGAYEYTVVENSVLIIELDQFTAVPQAAPQTASQEASQAAPQAAPQNGHIVLTWTTLSEIDIAGFNLWRSEVKEGESEAEGNKAKGDKAEGDKAEAGTYTKAEAGAYTKGKEAGAGAYTRINAVPSVQVPLLTQEEAGTYTRINPYPIEATGGPTQKAEYSYIDDTARPGVTYSYKLEDIDTQGGGTFHGPVSAVIPVAQSASMD